MFIGVNPIICPIGMIGKIGKSLAEIENFLKEKYIQEMVLDKIVTDDTHYGQAGINQPYRVVFWYVKSPGESGFGTLVKTDYGDGSAITSYFEYTFNSGSTAGKEYEITAEVFPVDGQEDPTIPIDSDSDSYTVTVWTSPEDVITTPDELTITDDVKIGDYYAFNVDAASSDSSYVITEIEVLVNEVSIASQSFSNVTNASLSVSGYLDTNVASINVKGIIKWIIMGKAAELAAKLTPIAVITGTLYKTYDGMLKGTITGKCACPDDDDMLDNFSYGYTCPNTDRKFTHQNNTVVKWRLAADGPGKHKGSDATSQIQKGGRSIAVYSFPGEVPLGHSIMLDFKSTDMHSHFTHDANFNPIGHKKLGSVDIWHPRQSLQHFG